MFLLSPLRYEIQDFQMLLFFSSRWDVYSHNQILCNHIKQQHFDPLKFVKSFQVKIN